MNINELLDNAKKFSNIPSDAQLAKKLNISGAAVSKWRNEGFYPTVENAHQLATLANLDPAQIIADVLIQGAKEPDVKSTLNRIKKMLAEAALVVPALVMGVQYCILCKTEHQAEHGQVRKCINPHSDNEYCKY